MLRLFEANHGGVLRFGYYVALWLRWGPGAAVVAKWCRSGARGAAYGWVWVHASEEREIGAHVGLVQVFAFSTLSRGAGRHG
jgi:hypothetical protein